MAPSTQPAFVKDEKTLCFHHDLLYEAKVLDSKLTDANDKKSGYQYKVHYKGWKNTWDDWVPQDRLRKLNDENKELAANLKKELEESIRATTTSKSSTSTTNKRKNKGLDRGLNAAAGAGSSSGGSGGGGSGSAAYGKNGEEILGLSRKKGRELDNEREDTFHTRPTVRILLPDRLKSILVDDWENVTRNLQLVRLPARYPASAILNAYAAHEAPKRPAGTPDADILEEILAGLREYFNKCLGRLLLYRFEREQFYAVWQAMEGTATKKGVGMADGDVGGNGIVAVDEDGTEKGVGGSEDGDPTEALAALAGKSIEDVYGGEHLLRLFVLFPELVAQTNMDAPSVARLREELTKFTLWLSRDQQVDRYLSEPYVNASPGYIERAKGG